MSRSQKNRHLKTGAYFHWCSYRSNKKDKQLANRTVRHTNRIRVRFDKDPVSLREKSDVWNFSSDGRCYYRSFLERRYYGLIWSKEDIRKINTK